MLQSTISITLLCCTCADDRDPLVELILVWDGVELAALHLAEGGVFLGAWLDVADPVSFPFACAVLPPEFRPAEGKQTGC